MSLIHRATLNRRLDRIIAAAAPASPGSIGSGTCADAAAKSGLNSAGAADPAGNDIP